MHRVQGVLRRTRSGRSAGGGVVKHHHEDVSLDRPRRPGVSLLGGGNTCRHITKGGHGGGDDIGESHSTLASSGASAAAFDADGVIKAIVDADESGRLPPPPGEPSSESESSHQPAVAVSSATKATTVVGREDDNENEGEKEEDLSDLSASDDTLRRRRRGDGGGGRRAPAPPPSRRRSSSPPQQQKPLGRPACSEDDDDEKDIDDDDDRALETMRRQIRAAAADGEADLDENDDETADNADKLRVEMEALRAQLATLRSENELLKRGSGGGGATSPAADADRDEGEKDSSRWERYRRSSPAKMADADANEHIESTRRRRSCMAVRTLDESLHSHGLSRHGRSRHGGTNTMKKGSDATRLDGSSSSSDHLSVGFAAVEVRHYPRRIGDHPCVNAGPPVTIGWDHDESRHAVVSVDEFEHVKEEEKSSCRLSKVRVLTRDEREDMLKDVGHSRKEMANAVREVERQKRSRRKAVHNVKLDWFDEGVESAGRKLKRLVLRKKKDSALYERWRRSERERARAAIAEENAASARHHNRDAGDDAHGDERYDEQMEATAAGKSLALSDDDDSDHMINGYSWSKKSNKAASNTGGIAKFAFGTGKASAAAGATSSKAIAIEEDSTHRPKARRGRAAGGPPPRRNSRGAIAA